MKVLCQRHASYYAGQAHDPRSGTGSAPTESPRMRPTRERERGRGRDPLNFVAARGSLLADAPAIGERALESDPNDSH